MKVLALDISSSTGWALLSGEPDPDRIVVPMIQGYGTLELPQRVKEYADGKYPWAIQAASVYMGAVAWGKVLETKPDVIVVECVNKARARMSQQFLDAVHAELWQHLIDGGYRDKLFYVDSSEWRRVTGCIMDKASKKANAKLAKAKRTAAQKGTKLDRKALGIKGKITKKHVALARVNELFGLSLKVKDNDVADALAEGLSYFWHARPTELE